MSRPPRVRWVERLKAYRSDVGPISPKSGRRLPKYFRDLPNTDKGRHQAEAEMFAYVKQREKDEAAGRVSRTDPQVWQLVEMYVAHSERTKKPATVEGHATRLGLWMRRAPGAIVDREGIVVDTRPAKSLKAADLSRVKREMLAEGLAPGYVASLMTSVKSCFAWAASDDEEAGRKRLIPADPFASVDKPTCPDSPERYIDPDRAEALLAWIDARAAAMPGVSGEMERLTALMFRCMYESGARPSELCRATWDDFREESGVILLKQHKTDGKTRRPRMVPLPEATARKLLEVKAREGRHPTAIFTHRRGRGAAQRGQDTASGGEPWKVGPLGQKFRKLRQEAARAGLDVLVRDGTGRVPEEDPEVTLYDLRRSFATDADPFGNERTAGVMGNSAAMVGGRYKTRLAASAVEVVEEVARRRRGDQDANRGSDSSA